MRATVWTPTVKAEMDGTPDECIINAFAALDTPERRAECIARLQAIDARRSGTTHPNPRDIATLRAIMERENDWCGQGGAMGYLGKGKWSFVRSSLDITNDELNALFRLAGVEPRQIQSRGHCSDCAHARDRRERGYEKPCVSCARPIMSNFTPRV